MLSTLFATKNAMTQAWSQAGKRLAVTKLTVEPNMLVAVSEVEVRDNKFSPFRKQNILQIGYGKKKLEKMPKPLRKQIKRSGFSFGAKKLYGVRVAEEDVAELKPGETAELSQVLAVGDVVAVQGVSKGRGFAGAMKRHGFHGGPRTHGQSDRERAVGSIGAGTYPGKVWKGKKMPGHYGVDTKTVSGLVVLYLDPEKNEVWLSGPIPGSYNSTVKIQKTGKSKEIALDLEASGLEKPEDRSQKPENKNQKPEEESQKAEDKNQREESNK